MPNLLLIRELARRKNISLRDLADRVGISYQGLQKAIKENSTRQSTLVKIANALDEGVDTFYKYASFDDYIKDKYSNDTLQESKKNEEIQSLRQQLKQQSDYINILKKEIDRCHSLLKTK